MGVLCRKHRKRIICYLSDGIRRNHKHRRDDHCVLIAVQYAKYDVWVWVKYRKYGILSVNEGNVDIFKVGNLCMPRSTNPKCNRGQL